MPVYRNDPGLVSLWTFEDASNPGKDHKNANNLTDNNTVGVSADAQEGLQSADFERDNTEYLSITNAAQVGLGITGNITVCAWVKFETLVSTAVGFALAGKRLPTTNQRSYILYASEISAGQYFPAMEISQDGTTINNCYGATQLSTGVWYHIAGVYDGIDIRVYLDGLLDSNGANNPKTYSSGIFNSTAEFRIGTQASSTFKLDGLVDEDAVFNRALSATEVSDVFTYGIKQFPYQRPLNTLLRM